MASTRNNPDVLDYSRDEQHMNAALDVFNQFEAPEAYRGAEMKAQTHTFYGSKSSFPKKPSLENEGSTSVSFPVFKDHDLSSLYCSSSKDPKVVWGFVQDFVNDDERKVDSEVNENAKCVYGNFYQASSNCQFMASVAKLQKQKDCVVDVRRLGGNAFLLKNFFDELVKFLIEAQVVEAKEEEDYDFGDGGDFEDYDDLFASDDDGDDDEGLQLELPDLDPHSTMMEFEYDPHFLHMMINGFSDTHMEEKNYFMGLLSHNATRPENRSLMLGEEVRDQMKNLIQRQLKTERDCSNASLTRDTCLLLKNLACDMEIDNETVKAASKAAAIWCPGNKGRSHVSDILSLSYFVKNSEDDIGELQGSRQALFEITEFLSNLRDSESYPQYTESALLDIIRDTLTKEQIQRVSEFASNRNLDILECLRETECN